MLEGSPTRRTASLAALATLLAVSLMPVSSASARDAVVPSFDGTPLAVSFFAAPGLEPGKRAPTVLVGHGFGQSRETDPSSTGDGQLFGSIGLKPLLDAGFNVLTWDARGFGQSGGRVMADSADFEGRDVSALIDFVAKQPEALLDSAGDPRVGMNGVSYGGAIQLVAASQDQRIDAITPTISFNRILSILYKANLFKAGWGSALLGIAEPTSLAQGLLSPVGPQTGDFDPRLTQAVLEAEATGHISQASYDFFNAIGPGERVARIKAPTLLVQGTADTLTTLQEGIDSYRFLRSAGTPVKMIWFCGGHGVCLTDKGPASFVRDAVVGWLRRYLGGEKVATGPGFQWTDQDGRVRSAAAYGTAPDPALAAVGSGSFAIKPGLGAGAGVAATPTPGGLDIPIPPPAEPADLVGPPTLTLDYQGSASPASTYVFAQIVDETRGLVAGNQVTPVPVSLDGSPHHLVLPLEALSQHATPSSRYSLELIDATSVYSAQRSAGAMTVTNAKIAIPAVSAAAKAAKGLRLRLRVRRLGPHRVRVSVRGTGINRIASAQFFVDHQSVATDRHRRFVHVVGLIPRGKRSYRLNVRVRLRGGGGLRLRSSLRTG